MEIVFSVLLMCSWSTFAHVLNQVPHLLASIGPPTGAVYLELIFGCIFAIYMVVRAMSLTSDAAYVRERRSRHSKLK